MSNQGSANADDREFTFEAGSSRALLIHGFMGSPRELRPLGQALADAGVTAHAPLLPGFGPDMGRLRSIHASDWLSAARAAWERLREGASRTTLIGFSMGGAVALRLAAEAGLHPDQLILLAPHWKFADKRATLLPVAKLVMREIKPFGDPDFENEDSRRMLAGIAPGADLDDPAVRHQLRNALTIPTRALDELRKIGNVGSSAASHISVPTTILQGQEDPTTLPQYSRLLAARMGAELLEFPGDHLIVDPDRPSWSTVRDAVVARATGAGIR